MFIPGFLLVTGDKDNTHPIGQLFKFYPFGISMKNKFTFDQHQLALVEMVYRQMPNLPCSTKYFRKHSPVNGVLNL